MSVFPDVPRGSVPADYYSQYISRNSDDYFAPSESRTNNKPTTLFHALFILAATNLECLESLHASTKAVSYWFLSNRLQLKPKRQMQFLLALASSWIVTVPGIKVAGTEIQSADKLKLLCS